MLYRGGAEKKIRKYLVDNNYVDTVIQLPPDLFFGTPIAWVPFFQTADPSVKRKSAPAA